MSVDITPEFKEALLENITSTLAKGQPPFEVVFITNWQGKTAEVINVEGGLPGAILQIQYNGDPNLPFSWHCICNLSWVMKPEPEDDDEEDEDDD